MWQVVYLRHEPGSRAEDTEKKQGRRESHEQREVSALELWYGVGWQGYPLTNEKLFPENTHGYSVPVSHSM